MIKKYKEFMIEHHHKSEDYKVGCVMIELDIPNWDEITKIIKDEDMYDPPGDKTKGIESDPHVTVFFGLLPTVNDADVINIINKYKHSHLDIDITGVDNFKNAEFDVVKFSVNKNKTLSDFHDDLSKLPNAETFTEYIPHITISFINKGCSDKYIDPNFKLNDVKIKCIKYSKSNGQKLYFNLY